MKIYRSSSRFPRSAKFPVVALGNFDGAHLAHQAMFRLAKKTAEKRGGTAVAYTFEPHPVRVLSKESAPLMLNTLEQKLELLKAHGMNAAVIEPFTRAFAHWSAERWLKEVFLKRLHPGAAVIGYDFTFGSHRSGTVETLEAFCRQHGILCKVLPAQMKGETLISSTQIRNFVLRGDVRHARELLGRPYFIDGQVVRGAGRGAGLGIPTANLKPVNELLPLPGVYAAWAEAGNKTYPSVVNIGVNPTFGGNSLTVEAHLLRFKGNLYGKKMRIRFLDRLREERRFASAKELVRQIRVDILRARKVFKNWEMKRGWEEAKSI